MVSLIPLSVEDLELLLAWAWIPEIWKYMPTSRHKERLSWDTHYSWYKDRANKDRRDWVVVYSGGDQPPRRVGVVHAVGVSTPSPEVGIYIGEVGLWGKDIGYKAICSLVSTMGHHSYECLLAHIHPENKPSIKIFTKSGFTKIGKGRKGQDLYEYRF